LVRRCAEEIVGVGNFGLEAGDAAQNAECSTVVVVLILAIGDLRAAGIAAEIVSIEGADESLGVRLACGACEDHRSQDVDPRSPE
jgi:hypothetical protein